MDGEEAVEAERTVAAVAVEVGTKVAMAAMAAEASVTRDLSVAGMASVQIGIGAAAGMTGKPGTVEDTVAEEAEAVTVVATVTAAGRTVGAVDLPRETAGRGRTGDSCPDLQPRLAYR